MVCTMLVEEQMSLQWREVNKILHFHVISGCFWWLVTIVQ